MGLFCAAPHIRPLPIYPSLPHESNQSDDYNQHPPHSALGNRTPEEFAQITRMKRQAA